MKKSLSIIILLFMLLNLCACGNRGDSQLKTEAVTLSSIDSNTGTWLGLGGCYQLEPFKAPDNCVSILQHGGEFYFLIEKDTGEIHILHGEEEIYYCSGVADSVFSSEKGIWLQFNEWDGESWDAVISLLSYEGEELKTTRIETPPDCYIRQFVAAEGFLFLNSSSALLVYNEDGTPISSIPHEEWMGGILLGGDGKVYYTDQEENGGGNLYAVDTAAWTFQEIFSYERGYIFSGNDESPFLLMLPDGIYHLYMDGSSDPLVIWDECGIRVNGVSGIEPLEDGSFLLAGMLMEPQRLYPADPATIKPLTEIIICMIPSQSVLESGKDPLLFYSNLSRNVAAFNAQSSDCFVRILDLTENGKLTAEQALTKLNTQIMSGYRPDMLLLDGAISPFPFIRQGLLRDLSQDIEHDEQMRMEDILIANAVVNDCGGLYLMTNSFRFETRIGLSSRFGNVWGWSFDQYLDIARKTPEGHMVMYNLTRDYFLENSVSRYCRQAIDWPHGTCDFNNPDFASLLEACSNVIETPEDPNNVVFGPNLMSDGYLVTDLVMVARVTDLASESRHTGQGISVIGWPTPDGSCGTDFYINEPVGVVNGSAHPDLCWKFLKYCLLTPQYGLPVYRPLMEQQIEKARNIEPASNQETNYDELSSPMTEEEIAFFRELLSRVEHTSLCDETVLDVIHQEADRFLVGQCTAEEAAAKTQSRLSIYISEQS